MILFDKKIRPRRQTPNGVRIIHTVPPESFTLSMQLIRRKWYPCRFASEPSSVISHSSFSVDATSTERVSLG